MTARQRDRVHVHQAAADRLLGTLPDRSIDVLVTDPPYLTVNRRAESGHLRDWFADGLTWPQIGRVLTIAHRKLKPSGLLFLMTNGDGLAGALAALEKAGFIGIRTITWDRRWPDSVAASAIGRSSSSSGAWPGRGPLAAPTSSRSRPSVPRRRTATPPRSRRGSAGRSPRSRASAPPISSSIRSAARDRSLSARPSGVRPLLAGTLPRGRSGSRPPGSAAPSRPANGDRLPPPARSRQPPARSGTDPDRQDLVPGPANPDEQPRQSIDPALPAECRSCPGCGAGCGTGWTRPRRPARPGACHLYPAGPCPAPVRDGAGLIGAIEV
jgi:hypothetical protein